MRWYNMFHHYVHILHGDREFLAGGLCEGQSEYGYDFSLASTDKEVVVLERDMNNKKVI